MFFLNKREEKEEGGNKKIRIRLRGGGTKKIKLLLFVIVCLFVCFVFVCNFFLLVDFTCGERIELWDTAVQNMYSIVFFLLSFTYRVCSIVWGGKKTKIIPSPSRHVLRCPSHW